MSKKSFRIARKPGQGAASESVEVASVSGHEPRTRKTAPLPSPVTDSGIGLTTRKTIEVPEGYFRRVKIRAVERGMLEKELWAEILGEYFKNHPDS